MRENDDDERQHRDPRLGFEQRLPPARGGKREHQHRGDQDQPDITGEQQQTEIERQQEPIAAFAFADRAPVMQQRQRPQRRSQNRGTEIRARHRKSRHTDHQQYREHRVARADDAAAKRENRPIGDYDTALRQRVEPQGTRQTKRNFAHPERQRRPEITAQDEFVAYGQQQRHFAGRRAVEQRRHQRPYRGLCERHGPEHRRRAAAQEFDNQGNVMHWPANFLSLP